MSFLVENFLGIPVGALIPVGAYAGQLGIWLPEATQGNVIEIVAETAGLADIDVTGDGVADDPSVLSTIGLSNEEREAMAQIYAPGAQLWRVRVHHFSSYDFNFTPALPPDAETPIGEVNSVNNDEVSNDVECGSIVRTHNQTLGESVAVAGTNYRLTYDSGAVDGHSNRLNIKLTGANVPSSLEGVELKIEVAGQTHQLAFAPAANLTHEFVWDGLDAFGRPLQGRRRATITINHVYSARYSFCEYGTGNNVRFAAAPTQQCPSSAVGIVNIDRPFRLEQIIKTTIGGMISTGFDLGGWRLDAQHVIDKIGNRVSTGSGSDVDLAPYAVFNYALDAENEPLQTGLFAAAPDGSIVFFDGTATSLLRYRSDGGVAFIADYPSPTVMGLAVAPNGDIYVAEDGLGGSDIIRRVDAQGAITTVGGGGTTPIDNCEEEGVANVASLTVAPRSLAVGPDLSVFYICDGTSSGTRIKRIMPDGNVYSVAGYGVAAADDGVFAKEAFLRANALAVDVDGQVHFSDADGYVWRISNDGILHRVAGNSATPGYWSGDGGPALTAGIGTAVSLSFGPERSLWLFEASHCPPGGTDPCESAIRKIDARGIINTVAGNYGEYTEPDFESPIVGVPLTGGPIGQGSSSTVVTDDGRLFTDTYPEGNIVWGGAPALHEAAIRSVPSRDGRRRFVFDERGRHKRTEDAITGERLETFAYDDVGRLTEIDDRHGLTTTIERTLSGAPVAIVSPYGKRTELVLANGLLQSVEDPSGNTHEFTYAPGTALLATFKTPNGGVHEMTYSAVGRLELDENPAGGSKSFVKSGSAAAYTVAMTTAEGRTRSYTLVRDGEGETRSTTGFDGLQTETSLAPTARRRGQHPTEPLGGSVWVHRRCGECLRLWLLAKRRRLPGACCVSSSGSGK